MISYFLPPKVISDAPNVANEFAAGAPPRTPLQVTAGALPRAPNRLGIGIPSPHFHPPRRLQRLVVSAFGVLLHYLLTYHSGSASDNGFLAFFVRKTKQAGQLQFEPTLVLSVPASSAPAENIFSRGGLVVTVYVHWPIFC